MAVNKAYYWRNDLETGYTAIDLYNKLMLYTVEQLLDACYENRTGTELNIILDFMKEYMVIHAADERLLMAQCDYPYNKEHIRAHDELRMNFQRICDEIYKNGVTDNVIRSLHENVGGNLLKHIREEDARMAGYMREREELKIIAQ